MTNDEAKEMVRRELPDKFVNNENVAEHWVFTRHESDRSSTRPGIMSCSETIKFAGDIELRPGRCRTAGPPGIVQYDWDVAVARHDDHRRLLDVLIAVEISDVYEHNDCESGMGEEEKNE